jgi:DNA polymerase-1
MNRLHETFQKKGFKSKMILQVHDELVFEAPKDEVVEVSKVIHRIMCEAYKLDAALEVEVKSGNNWLEMKVVDVA